MTAATPPGARIYLLDTNIFLTLRRQYSRQTFVGVWDWFVQKNREGAIASIDLVWDEIKDKDIREWLTAEKFTFGGPTTESETKLREVYEWLQHSNYDQGSIERFNGKADASLIAHAAASGRIVVTEERKTRVPGPGEKEQPPHITIPNVCKALDVGCVSCIEMLQNENAKFILGKDPDQSENSS